MVDSGFRLENVYYSILTKLPDLFFGLLAMVETLVSERKNILEFDTNSLLKILINEVGLYYN